VIGAQKTRSVKRERIRSYGRKRIKERGELTHWK
jgi:hypothetical protein